jgi:hypothetical protein
MKNCDFYVYGYFEPGSEVPFYVGKGRGKRAYVHLEPKNIKQQWPFHRKLRKMAAAGVRPKVELLATGLTEEAAFAAERRLIATYGRRNNGTGVLLNLTDGGDGPTGRVVSQATRNLSRRILTGRKLTPEHCAAISRAQKGRKQSPEGVAKRAAARRGKPRSDATVAKMREATKRQFQNPEAGKIIAEANRRRVWTPEARAKVSKANTGQAVPRERVERMKASLSKPVESFNPMTGETVARYPSATAAATEGYNKGHISAVCKGTRPLHGGLGWRFSSPVSLQLPSGQPDTARVNSRL